MKELAGDATVKVASWIAILAVAGLSLAPLAAIVSGTAWGRDAGPGNALRSSLATLLEPRSLRALRFTLTQAAISTVAALAVGLPGAWLVARYRFRGRRLLKSLSAIPFSVPPLLVVLAFVLYYGRGGYLNRLLMALFSLKQPPLGFLYSFWGIVLVHGFYNFPIVLQNVGEVWARLPRDREEAARLLGAGRGRAFATGTLPSLLPSLAQAAALTFLFCYFSFAVVLVFGSLVGSTLEVEVYRRARIEADPAGASAIALAETAMALIVVSLIGLVERRDATALRAGSPQPLLRPHGPARMALAVYAIVLVLFFGGPLFALAVESFTVRRGMGGAGVAGLGNFVRLLTDAGLARSLADTALTAVPAASAALVAGSLVAMGLRGGGCRGSILLSLPLAVSSIVASLGWSIIFPRGGNALIAPVLALVAFPFVAKAVVGALAVLEVSPPLAARVLGASRLRAAVDMDFRAVAPSLLAAGAFAFAIAAGDLNVPIILGRGTFEPLPILLYRLASAYRFPEACAAGLLLGLITGIVFFIKEGRSDA